MKSGRNPRHVIDFLFPVILFFVFVLSAVGVLVITADFYSTTTYEIQAKDEARTTLSYIATKIRQNDIEGGISIEKLDGKDCLSIKATKNGIDCHTYIYMHDGKLKELFVMDGVDIHLSDGTPIEDVSLFEMKALSDHLFMFTITDEMGNEQSQIISERSAK